MIERLFEIRKRNIKKEQFGSIPLFLLFKTVMTVTTTQPYSCFAPPDTRANGSILARSLGAGGMCVFSFTDWATLVRAFSRVSWQSGASAWRQRLSRIPLVFSALPVS